MTILITGAYGFVGTNLCRYLVDKGHKCLALDVPKAKRDDVPYSEFHTWDELGGIGSIVFRDEETLLTPQVPLQNLGICV